MYEYRVILLRIRTTHYNQLKNLIEGIRVRDVFMYTP